MRFNQIKRIVQLSGVEARERHITYIDALLRDDGYKEVKRGALSYIKLIQSQIEYLKEL